MKREQPSHDTAGPAPLLKAVLLAFLAGATACGPDDAANRNDRGVALMGQYEYAQAERAFAAAVDAAPEWLTARINRAIAILNRQDEGDEQRALGILSVVLEMNPNEPRALYTSAILRYYGGDIEPAKALFARVVEIDPSDAHAAYFLGLTHLQTGDNDDAGKWFLRSVELDPHLLSGYYTGAQALRRAGHEERAAAMLDDYLRLKPNPAAHLAEIAYGRMGPKATALAASPDPVARPQPLDGPLFDPAHRLEGVPAGDRAIAVVDIEGDGALDIVLNDGRSIRVLAGTPAGGFSTVPSPPFLTAKTVVATLWGDIDDDGIVDAILCGTRGVDYWRQAPPGEWSLNRTLGDEPCVSGAVVDADHDGDLDVIAIGPEGNELHSNNRDGTFRRLAAEMGIVGTGDGRQAVLADLDGDRDLDMLVINRSTPHDIWQNDRTWQYRAMPGLDDLRQTPLAAATVADADADGHREIFGLTTDGTLLRWQHDGLTWTRAPLVTPDAEIAPGAVAELAVADFDGDGRLELLRVQADTFAVIDPRQATVVFEAHAPGAAGSLVLASDPVRGPAVLVSDRAGVSLWPPGTGRHDYLTVSPTGRSDADTMRSNASGIGTVLRVRAAGRWTVLDRLDSHSGSSQSLQPLAAGLGGHHQADFIALDWTDGVSQTEIELAAKEHHVIPEIQRQLASCPVLFAWNGEAFEFVSDILGVGGIGFFEAPGRHAPPRPTEAFLLDGESMAARHGRYALKLSEPMEENAYLDAAELTVYDLPVGWEMVLDERFAAGSDAPTGRPITFRRAMSPQRVTDAEGRDVTDLATMKDRRAPAPGAVDSRFIGLLTEDQALTLEFGSPLDREGAVLVADGWIEYPYSQTVFAVWQAGLGYRPASLEARTGDGEWTTIAEEFGYPAGMPRTMALPLPKLPPGTDALRLSSNMEIYWDRLRVVWEEPLGNMVTATLEPVTARVARTGFAKRTTGPQRLPHYDYAKRSPYWDAKAPQGLYTSFGDARELVRDTDGALAIISSGEEVHLEFDAPPEAPPGHRRFFRIVFHGWAKDMDLYTRDGDTLDPMPIPDDADPSTLAKRDRLHARYNVRFRQGL